MKPRVKRILLLLPALLSTAALVAACTPEETSGIPIEGSLSSAAGASAQLTWLLEEPPQGTGFSLSATLDGVPVTGSGSWSCWAPLPPEYPNYDIEATDGSTYGFFLSISPAVWGTGSIAIDNQYVRLLVATPDRFGVATSGSLFISSAGTFPDQAGHECGFSVSNVALEGEKDR